jgi:hypothetical protein
MPESSVEVEVEVEDDDEWCPLSSAVESWLLEWCPLSSLDPEALVGVGVGELSSLEEEEVEDDDGDGVESVVIELVSTTSPTTPALALAMTPPVSRTTPRADAMEMAVHVVRVFMV